MSVARLVLIGAALGFIAGGCATSTRIVMVSGRDDHGLVARPAIALQRSPTDSTVAGSVPDGGFVRVIKDERTWLLVRTIAEPADEGWINEHDLRGVAVLRAGQQVMFKNARWRDGRVEILVVPAGGGDEAWVAASELKEVGAR